jgi:hypothetical protein
MGAGSAWSEADREVVAGYLKLGKSLTQISRLLGVTRGVVTGRIWRDGALRAVVGQGHAAGKVARGKERRARQAPAPGAGPRWGAFRCDGVSEPAYAVAVAAVPGKALVELGRDECRWPVGERGDVIGRFLFCAEPRAGDHTSYCARHYRRSVAGFLHDGAAPPNQASGRGAAPAGTMHSRRDQSWLDLVKVT